MVNVSLTVVRKIIKCENEGNFDVFTNKTKQHKFI